MKERLHMVMLEPYYGGSHAAFANRWRSRTRHRITLVTMPARKWKWRMRGAALWFTREGGQWLQRHHDEPIDLIFVSDMLSASDLRALLPPSMRSLPMIGYFHENQLTYPVPDESRRDYQYGMTNIISCLSVDAVWFNSAYHRTAFLTAAADLLHKMPDFVPAGIIEDIRVKSAVFPPPVDVSWGRDSQAASTVGHSLPTIGERQRHPPRILWCHRWEYDKNPEPFFDALFRLDREGHRFELVLLGEQFRTAPPVFADSWTRLKPHIVHTGFVPERSDYLHLLAGCDIVVSSAIQENFGIAVIEAILAGCRPLLPNRLSYPELIPDEFHDRVLYDEDHQLFGRLAGLVMGSDPLTNSERMKLRESLEIRFGASRAVRKMDDELIKVCDAMRGGSIKTNRC